MLFQKLGVAKTVTFDNFCAISRATALEHHRREPIFEGRNKPQFWSSRKLFQASRKMNLRFSYCRVSVIQFLDNADAAFRILCSVCGPFYPRPSCSQTSRTASNERTSAQPILGGVLTIFASGTHSRFGLPAQRAIAQRFRALAPLKTCRLH